jgi:hypothetical protein
MLNITSFLLYLLCIVVSFPPVLQAFSNNNEIGTIFSRLRENNIGPQTNPVKLDGYLGRDSYHEIRYVSQTNGADREGNGTKENPWATIQHALTQIVDAGLSNRYAVLVAEGLYAESTISLKEYVSLYGGFSSTTWERDIAIHKTILDGEGRNRVLLGAHHAKVDGFEIRHGVVRGRGGAILCDGTSPVISNNVFTQNKTLAPVPWDPEFLHEVAHDGGAIAAYNGASPVVKNNLFFLNSTETGRGGGIACHNRASPLIANNVFIDNMTGTNDPRRSSDGGAISIVLYSSPIIVNNIIVGNKALAVNDGGGIFSELWSSMILDGNVIIGNTSDDDGGGIFVSGQQHHYITLPDDIPPKERFQNYIRNNMIMGNATSMKEKSNHGVIRSTNDNRLFFENNLIAESIGGLDFRRTDLIARNNTIIANILIRESEYPSRLVKNIIIGDLRSESEVIIDDTEILDIEVGMIDTFIREIFTDDYQHYKVLDVAFNKEGYVSVIRLANMQSEADGFKYRIVRSNEHWGVIKHNDENTITVWGDFSDINELTIIPTYTIRQSTDLYERGIGHR